MIFSTPPKRVGFYLPYTNLTLAYYFGDFQGHRYKTRSCPNSFTSGNRRDGFLASLRLLLRRAAGHTGPTQSEELDDGL